MLFFKQHNSWSRESIRVQTWVSCNAIKPTANSTNCPNSIASQDKYNKQLKICAHAGHVVQGAPWCSLSKVSADQDVPAVLCAPLLAISKGWLNEVQFSWCHRCAKVDTRANDGTYLLQLEMLTCVQNTSHLCNPDLPPGHVAWNIKRILFWLLPPPKGSGFAQRHLPWGGL